MNETIERLSNKYQRLVHHVPLHFERSLTSEISWKSRGIVIQGAQGTGKSTLMLQYIKNNLPLEKTLYLSLDDLYFQENNLIDVTESFYQLGGRYLFLDEVHKYRNWQQEVKNIYDTFPEIQLVVSGSSILALQKSIADLSRRMVNYTLTELSLREFLALNYGISLSGVSLKDLLTDHVQISHEIQDVVSSPLALFTEYLMYGAYPFYLEDKDTYQLKLNQLINLVIDYDLPEARPIEISTQSKLKKLLYIISTSVPFKPNIQKLSDQVGTSRIRLLEMLHILDQVHLIHNLRSAVQGVSLMNKPDKIYLRNTNLSAVLGGQKLNMGNSRETFFLSQLVNAGYHVTYPKSGDFLVDGEISFEVGGQSKSTAQLKDVPQGYFALDGLEHGVGNKIPLWLFGLLY